MVQRHIKAIICCIISSVLIVCFQKTFTGAVPDYAIRLKLLPFVFLGIALIAYYNNFIVYLVLKLFGRLNVKIKDVINENIFGCAFIILITDIVNTILNQFTDARYIMYILSFISDAAFCWLVNKYCKGIHFEGKRKNISVLLIFVFIHVIWHLLNILI